MPSCGFRRRQWCSQPRVGKHQMVIGYGHPQLLLKPRQILGKPIRTADQTPVTLTLCEVVALNKTGVHSLTDRRGPQARPHGLWLAKHYVRAHRYHASFGAFLDDLRIHQAWKRPAASFGSGTASALAFGLVPFAVRGQQCVLVYGQLIAGKKWNVIICCTKPLRGSFLVTPACSCIAFDALSFLQ